jgi:tryptophanyl-tRNA synthetase
MSADILIHRGVKVPVGKDQEQHLEMARNFAQRFNNRYGYLFPEPVPFNYGDDLVKIPSLDGTGKMSKSENQMATLYLSDSDELIIKKLNKAKTDSTAIGEGAQMPESVQNLFLLMEQVSTPDAIAFFKDQYNSTGIRFGDMKKQLGEDMVTFIAPIREKALELQQDHAYLNRIMKTGAEKARESAAQTLLEARKLIGINYY